MNLQVEPPAEKKTPPPALPSTSPSFSLLPDEIAVNCLARISRAYYPRYSIISKSFRSLLSSKDLYSARSQTGSTEQCLYVCLSDEKCPRWYTLWINPNRTTLDKTTHGNSLAPIPSSEFTSVSQSTLVVDSEIYVIGGPIKTEPSCPSSTVRILDCRTHTWRDAPSMIVARKDALACFYDGKIYVMGGCGELEEPWAEVLDVKTQTWEPLSDPGAEIRRCVFHRIKDIKGKIYFWYSYRTYGYAYDINRDNWESVEELEKSACLMDGGVLYHRIPESACVLDDVWYDLCPGSYCWWTKDGEHWRVVKGLDSLMIMFDINGGFIGNTAKLVGCGGKLLFMWEVYREHDPSNMKKIWCAEITMETDNEGQVWGKFGWIDIVQRVPTHCALLRCLVASV
ncbi:F-box/kelch-repeat protein [Raphanus sativus]|uniref:F-box/kelch-repeat protein At4g19870-like n=1 Tax=Raphanus sativus TaxID=3726 RepID=A0A6J0KSK1_RAPSA|nr:F-box/kelch-repeat protein At4g19870-like [Raphanus sativus]KAJ4880971.1 F-box/kelch-repeat protein [Raphanus sativus]